MFSIVKIFFLASLVFLSFCSKKEKIDVISTDNLEMQMIISYEEGFKILETGDGFGAAKKFADSELLYPQSEWASKSALMNAYSYYMSSYYQEAIFSLERFLKVYPKDPRKSYAYFLLAMCYYENIVDEKKDLKPLLLAQKHFNYIVKEYPNSDFALDAKFKLGLINDVLAAKEIYIAKHYIKKEKWVAAINRLKTILEDYSTTIYVEEALHRLVEIHYNIGLIDEAEKYAKVLGYNYLSSEWYDETYKIFNQGYENPIKKIQKQKKNRIKNKFISLFKRQ
jgi:outer membrane protein assembly factor BamD